MFCRSFVHIYLSFDILLRSLLLLIIAWCNNQKFKLFLAMKSFFKMAELL